MRTEKTPVGEAVAAQSEPPVPTVVEPDVAVAVEREFERFRAMRAELRQQSGTRRRSCLRLDALN